QDIFVFSQFELRKASTYTTYSWGEKPVCRTSYDTLAVEWSVEGPNGRGDLILEDNPNVSVYVARFPRRLITSRDDLGVFLSKILADGKPPLKLGISTWVFDVAPGLP